MNPDRSKNGRFTKENIGEKNQEWKGDAVGYTALHDWVKRNKPKQDYCTDCKQPKNRLQLANISQQYKRDINDFEWLCVSCHMRKDGRLDNLQKILKEKRWKKWRTVGTAKA